MQSRAGEEEQSERSVIETKVIATADRIIAFSPHERDAMARLYAADANKITLFQCGVDLEGYRPLNQKAARSSLVLNGEKILLYVGRVEPIKGLDLLVETAAQMDSEDGVRMIVVGADVNGDREMDRVRQLAREKDLND